MEGGILTEVVLPLSIFVIMVTMGMTLTPADFRRVLSAPRAVAVGLTCQLLVLPLLGFGVANVFQLEPVFAVGVVLLAASPGGTTSNLIVHVADADRALSVTLTALSSTVVFVTMPVLLQLALDVFRPAGDATVSVPVVETMVQVAGITVVPVLIGMFVRSRSPSFADRAEQPGKVFATVFLFAIILAIAVGEFDTLTDEGLRFAPAFITLNLLALGAGFAISRAARLDGLRSITIAIETGLQNSTLAIGVALTLLDDGDLAVIPALYGVWMLLTGFGFALFLARTGGATQLDAALDAR